MSNQVFPSLPGLDIKVVRSHTYSTLIQAAASGKELRSSMTSSPRYSYELRVNFLRQAGYYNAVIDEVNQLKAFFDAHLGRWDSFLFSDPVESSVTSKTFMVGNGALTTGQLCDGTGLPVTEINGTPTIYRTDWQGTYVLSPNPRTNYALYANDLSNGYWSKNATTIDSSLYLAPDGTTRANRMIETATTAAHNVTKVSPVGLSTGVPTVAFSDCAQSGQRWLRFATDGGAIVAFFDLANGLVGSLFGGCTATITPLQNGFYRCAIFYTPTTSTNLIWGMSSNGSGSSYLGDTAKGVLITNINAYPGTVLGSHIPTGASAVTVTDYTLSASGLVTLAPTTNPVVGKNLGPANGSTAAFTITTPNGSTPTVTGVWRTDWQGRQRMYPTARTNLWTYSGDLSNAAWVVVNSGTGTIPSVTANYAAAPDGTTTATRFVCARGAGATTSDYSVMSRTLIGTSGVTYSDSIWLKSNTGANQTIQLYFSGITGSTTSSTVTVTPVWQRFSIEALSTGTAIGIQFGTRGAGSDANVDFLAWGGDLKQGALSSYIPTTTSAVTVTDYSVSTFTVTFATNPLAGAVIEADYTYVGGLGVGNTLAWSGSYYRRVRFDQDDLGIEQMLQGAWDGKTINLISVK